MCHTLQYEYIPYNLLPVTIQTYLQLHYTNLHRITVKYCLFRKSSEVVLSQMGSSSQRRPGGRLLHEVCPQLHGDVTGAGQPWTM